MTYSTACNIDINTTLDISLIDKNMDDGDHVYFHNKSINVVSPEGTLCKNQVSLAERLTERLNNAGRKSLAERTIKKKLITYKELKSLVHQINKPRTLQTLLANDYLQWSINHESFPDFVKENMKKNNILTVPGDIHEFSRISCNQSNMYSLVLIKYLVTQSMEIDYNCRYNDLTEELANCIQLLLNNDSLISTPELLERTKHITYLECLHTIWKQQDSEAWDRLTQPTTTHSHVSFSSETSLSDKLHKSQVLDSNASSSRQEAETTNKETINNPSHEPLVTLSKSTVPDKINGSQLSMLDKEQEEETPKPESKVKRKSKKSRKKIKHAVSSKDYLKPSQTLLVSPQKTITKETIPLPENSSGETSFAFQKDRPKKTLSPLLPENNSNEASLASSQRSKTKETTTPSEMYPCNTSFASQGARPKEFASQEGARPKEFASQEEARPKEFTSQEEARSKEETTPQSKVNTDKTPLKPQKTMYEHEDFMTLLNIKITSSYQLSMLAKLCLKKILINAEKREATVLDYINDPKDDLKLEKAKMALNSAHWHTELYFNLLDKACKADNLQYFIEKRDLFIKHSYFMYGYPPHDIHSGKASMKSVKLIGAGINYYYILADGVTPVEAIDSCLNNFWLLNHDIRLQLSWNIAIRIVIGDMAFNNHFIDDHLYTDKFSLMPIKSSDKIKNRSRLFRLLQTMTPIRKFAVGYFYIFNNHPHYQFKNLNGDAEIIFALCTEIEPEERFLTSWSSKELTIEEIKDNMIKQYNEEPNHDKFIAPNDWKLLKTVIKALPSFEISSITKQSLLDAELEEEIYNNFFLLFNFNKIKAILTTHINFQQREKNKQSKHLQRAQKKGQTHQTHNWPAMISDRSDATSERIIKKQPESESSPMEILNKNIKSVNSEVRRHKKNNTPENAKRVKETFYELEAFYKKLKADNINIDANTQSHYNDVVKKIENILDMVNE